MLYLTAERQQLKDLLQQGHNGYHAGRQMPKVLVLGGSNKDSLEATGSAEGPGVLCMKQGPVGGNRKCRRSRYSVGKRKKESRKIP